MVSILLQLSIASYMCLHIADYEKDLKRIWKKKPCHVIQAKIDNFSIHLGSFHSLKPGGLLNDEVISVGCTLHMNVCSYTF